MDLEIVHLPPCLRFCVIEILERYIESEPKDRHLESIHEGFLNLHQKFVYLEKHIFNLGTSTTRERQRTAAASVAAAALRILTDFATNKECGPCQKKASTQSQKPNQSNS